MASSFTPKNVKVPAPNGRKVKVRAVLSAGGEAGSRYYIQTDPMLVHGDYKLTIGPTLADTYGYALDENGNRIVGEKADAVTRTLTATEDVYRSKKALKRADGKGTTTYDPNQLVAKVKVRSNATVANVRVGFSITHTYASDLRISLVSPQGTTVSLINRRPWTGGGSGYERTLLDDAAGTSIAAGTSPFRGSFRPESPLSAFDGESAKGTWQLVIEDGWLGDTGRLLDWALYITPASAAPPLAPLDLSGGLPAYTPPPDHSADTGIPSWATEKRPEAATRPRSEVSLPVGRVAWPIPIGSLAPTRPILALGIDRDE